MKYALNLANDGRILSVTFEEYAAPDNYIVDALPDGDINDYCYLDGKFIHDPLNTAKKEASIERIAELKQKLAETDYNIIKIVEGAATLTEMSDIISQRSKWRAEINELEKGLT